MKKAVYLILMLLALMATACGDSEQFAIEGTVEDAPAINLRVVYYSNGKVFSGVTATTEGKFRFTGVAPKRALVEIFDNDYRLMCRTVASNGDMLEVKLKKGEPYQAKVSGSVDAERMAKFFNQNADSLASEAHNNIIASYVLANPGDELSGMLLVTEYNCHGPYAAVADSLWHTLSPEMRPDDIAQQFVATLERYNKRGISATILEIPYLASGNVRDTFRTADHPLTLLAVTDDRSKRDSIVKTLRQLDSLHRKQKLEILDVSVDLDTFIWRRNVRGDKAKWLQVWAPGSIAGPALNQFAIPAIPYFVAVDSLGTQLWRGENHIEAKNFITNYYD